MNDHPQAAQQAAAENPQPQATGDFNIQINIDARDGDTLVSFAGNNCNAAQVHRTVAMLHAIAEQLEPRPSSSQVIAMLIAASRNREAEAGDKTAEKTADKAQRRAQRARLVQPAPGEQQPVEAATEGQS